MRIVVDAFGGDNAPLEIIKGSADASNQFNVDITLTGNKNIIENIISENNLKFYGDLIIVDTDDVISMHDDPTAILKSHSNSSMALAFKELCENYFIRLNVLSMVGKYYTCKDKNNILKNGEIDLLQLRKT